MVFQVDVLYPGFPGKLLNAGLGWGAVALVRDDRHNILIDTGGPGIRGTLRGMLAKHSLSYGDIDIVTLSHLHWDHAYNVDYFPNAEFVFSKQEWQHANNVQEKDIYIEDKAISLLRTYKVRLIETDGEEIVPGMTAIVTPGHTPGCMCVVIDQGNGEKWLFAGDAAKNRRELSTGKATQTMDDEATTLSLKKMIQTASRILPGHDGWISIRNGEIIPEGANDATIVFEQGLTINKGLTQITLQLDL